MFGYEESYGCLIGDFVRDKDAVQASLMFCEAADYFKKQGKTLIDVLNEIFETYGYFADSLTSVTLKGAKGAEEAPAACLHHPPPSAGEPPVGVAICPLRAVVTPVSRLVLPVPFFLDD